MRHDIVDKTGASCLYVFNAQITPNSSLTCKLRR